MTEAEREAIQAAILLEYWGSASHMPQSWHKWAWAETDYAPEWLSESDLGIEHDRCVTVLHCGFSHPKPPKGWREVHQHVCGEPQCLDCEGTGKLPDEHSDRTDEPCPLCEGNGRIYWGEEWSLVVFAPALTYGAGQSGCLYDWGPERCTSLREAWTAIRDSLESVGLSRRSLVRVLRDLRSQGIHHFDSRLVPFVGWDYVEVQAP